MRLPYSVNMQSAKLQLGMNVVGRQVQIVVYSSLTLCHSVSPLGVQLLTGSISSHSPSLIMWLWRALLLIKNEEKRVLLSFVSFFLTPCSSSVLHLQGLGQQDGGCIMSRGGFTVRLATSSLSLSPPYSVYASLTSG